LPCVEHLVGLMHDEHGGFCNRAQLARAVGDDDRDFEHSIGLRIETAHLHVDPDEVASVLCHNEIHFQRAVIVSQFGPFHT
jgi:hypothetical protein